MILTQPFKRYGNIQIKKKKTQLPEHAVQALGRIEDLRSSRRPHRYSNYCRSMKKRSGPSPLPSSLSFKTTSSSSSHGELLPVIPLSCFDK